MRKYVKGKFFFDTEVKKKSCIFFLQGIKLDKWEELFVL